MANERRSISRLVNEATDTIGKGEWFLVFEEPNDLGNPTTYKIKLDTITANFLVADDIGNVDVKGNNLVNVGEIEGYLTNPITINSPLSSKTDLTEKHRLFPFAYFRVDTSTSVGASVPLFNSGNLQDNALFTEFNNTARIPNGKVGSISIRVDGEFNNDCRLEIRGSSYNEGTTTETPISTKTVVISDTVNTGVINGTFVVDFTAGVLAGEDLLIWAEIPVNTTGIYSITVQGLQ